MLDGITVNCYWPFDCDDFDYLWRFFFVARNARIDWDAMAQHKIDVIRQFWNVFFEVLTNFHKHPESSRFDQLNDDREMHGTYSLMTVAPSIEHWWVPKHMELPAKSTRASNLCRCHDNHGSSCPKSISSHTLSIGSLHIHTQMRVNTLAAHDTNTYISHTVGIE